MSGPPVSWMPPGRNRRSAPSAGVELRHVGSGAQLVLVSPDRIDRRPRPVVSLGERELRVYFGDLHRHSGASRCLLGIEARPEDRYAFARDVLRNDFFSLTEHPGHLDPLQWWQLAKLVAYVDRGGYPRWRDELRPPYVSEMVESLRESESRWVSEVVTNDEP